MTAPSIGSIRGLVDDPRSDRTKGLVPHIIESDLELADTLRRLAAEHQFGSRFNARLILAHGVDARIKDLRWKHDSPLGLETFIPVHGHNEIGSLAYYGANVPGRRPDPDTRAKERMLYMEVLEIPPRPLPKVEVGILGTDASDEDIDDLVELYNEAYTKYLTDFNVRTVRQMVESSLVLVVRNHIGRIVSVCVAEMAEIRFPSMDTLPLRCVEISDAATRISERGNGFYTVAKDQMVHAVRRQYGAFPLVITTEARAVSRRVLGSNLRLGFRYAGYQPMHCVIASDNDKDVAQAGHYGNLIVFYAP